MGLFNKGVDIDIPELQRKGIVKKSKKQIEGEAQTANLKADKDGFVEFTNFGANHTNETEIVKAIVENTQQSAQQPMNGDIFGSLASAVQNNSSSGFEGFSNSENSTNKQDSYSSVEHLKVKIEDLEYKLNGLIEKIAKLEAKLAD